MDFLIIVFLCVDSRNTNKTRWCKRKGENPANFGGMGQTKIVHIFGPLLVFLGLGLYLLPFDDGVTIQLLLAICMYKICFTVIAKSILITLSNFIEIISL